MLQKIYRPFIISLMVCMVLSCTVLLYKNVKIIGRVRLSDNPPEGHGGVSVFTNAVSTITTKDGHFELKGNITNEDVSIDINFEKLGYESKIYTLTIPKDYSDSLIDIGEIILEKIPRNIYDDFNDGNAEGWIEDSFATYNVENGEYSIEAHNDSYQHWAMHLFGPDGDFSFEAGTKYIAGYSYSAYGIGIFDTSGTRVCLFICGYQYYCLSYYNNSWHDIIDWAPSSLIDTALGSWNTLKIVKGGDSLRIYINESYIVSVLDSYLTKIRAIGLYVQDNLHIHFDNVNAQSR